MDNKLKKLEIKKLIQEYNFLLLDDEYRQEIISENKTDFLTKVEKLKSELGIINEPETPKKEEEVNLPKKPKIDSGQVSKSTKDKVKKLYREIAKKTHPDKTNSEELVNLYMRATVAAEDYNLFEIFIICNELNIDIDLDLEDKDTLITLIEMKKREIKSIEASFIWLYYMAKTEEEKNKLIELFVKKHGIKN
jgi:hypothetical protein